MNDLLYIKSLEILTAKLMHELITPVSAIASGLELMEDGHQDVFPILKESVEKALIYLTVFREGWGTKHTMSSEHCRKMLTQLIHLRKHRMSECTLHPNGDSMFRAVLAMTYLVSDLLVPEGVIKILSTTSKSIKIVFVGRILKTAKEMKVLLAVNPKEGDVYHILWSLTGHFLSVHHIQTEWMFCDDELTIVLRAPPLSLS